jgi:hypothetical protein
MAEFLLLTTSEAQILLLKDKKSTGRHRNRAMHRPAIRSVLLFASRQRLFAADDPLQLVPAGGDVPLIAVLGGLVVVHAAQFVRQVLLLNHAEL